MVKAASKEVHDQEAKIYRPKKRPRSETQQNVFKVSVIISFFIIVPYSYYTLAVNRYILATKPEGAIIPDFVSESPIMLFSAIAFAFLRVAIKFALRNHIFKIVPTHNDEGERLHEGERIAKASKIENHIVDILAYTSFAVVAYAFSYDQEWMPWYFGGSGDLNLWSKGLPYQQTCYPLIYLGYINAGYRIENLVQHLVHNSNDSDFQEMLLHDIVTVILFWSYLAGNIVGIGTMCALLHDVTDIPFHISKALHTSIYSKQSVWPFLLGQVAWLWLRLLCFPLIIISVYHTEYMQSLSKYQSQMTLNALFLCVIYSLHWLWFIMFQKLNLKVLRGVSVPAQQLSKK